jgi:pSer/pThr/pTyr-binding forkhead associated (FHA) protein
MTTLLATPILRLTRGANAGKRYEIRSALRIGRHPYNEVSVADLAMSRYHCWITLEEGATYVEDLASSNGTFLNGQRVQKRVALKAGDLLRAGETEFRLTEEE